MLELINVMFPIMFIIVVGIIIFSLVRGIITWNKNNQSPRLAVSVVVAAKRENITHHQHANVGDLSSAHGFHTTISTSYYVTFLVESGDRIELCVSGTEYGMLVEGDTGRLTFQGTRYLSFERIWICKGGLCMRIWKAIFSVLTIIFGSLGLMNIVSTNITLPIMFVFMGLTFLTNAKECYDKGAKKDAMIFVGIAIFVYVVTAYNLISRLM